MPSLSPKENYLRALRHEDTEYVPIMAFGPGGDASWVGVLNPIEKGQQAYGMKDGYGVPYSLSPAAAGGMIPTPGVFLLKDVTRWKKDVTFPSVKDIDWQKLKDTEYAMFGFDPDKIATGFLAGTGIWERLASLMGFEEAMIAMMEEPEACYDFFSAVTDIRIQEAEIAATVYHTDSYVNFDDIATERQLFMSPETYRKLIKPHHKRLNDAIKNLGMIPVQHTCGHAELCIEDYIETGAAAWNAVQASNDVAGLLDKYGSQICLEGCYDSTGKPGRPDATVEEVVGEVERCFREYGKRKGFIFMGALVAREGEDETSKKNAAMMEAAHRCRNALAK
ncbi:MAG: hypothetical protein LBQ35_05225 [Spirochaetaceae bacterium]|jgi:uroporphyrinogen-III decarboxylase|nr:hypothetical protein [Spirochaetaceae bacterium]